MVMGFLNKKTILFVMAKGFVIHVFLRHQTVQYKPLSPSVLLCRL